jgi:hypothetical protein
VPAIRSLAPVLVVAQVACGSRTIAEGSDETQTGAEISSSSAENTLSSDASVDSMTNSQDSSDSGASSSTGTVDEVPFCYGQLLNRDLGLDGACDVIAPPPQGAECDAWNDDCPPGQKCHQPLGGDARCVAVSATPVPLYEECQTSEDGTDDCDRDAYCSAGVCVGNCQCSPDFIHCNDPNAVCFGETGGPDGCYPLCDPLQFNADCPAGYYCHGGRYGFSCGPGGARPGSAEVGSLCYTDECAPGLVCLDTNKFGESDLHAPDRVPDCEPDASGCCVELCAMGGACATPMTECTAFGTEESAWVCTSGAGVCLLPA